MNMEMPALSEENPFIYGMPEAFVSALRELFDIMDSDRIGAVKYSDISCRWEEDDSDPFFPKGLIKCLKKVTLPNGLLTFDRFCAGIKLCLLKNQVDIANNNNNNNKVCTSSPTECNEAPPVPPHQTPPSLPRSPPPPLPADAPQPPSYHSLRGLTSVTSTAVPLPEAIHRKPTASVSPVNTLPYNKLIANSEYSSDSSSTTNANHTQRAKSLPHLISQNASPKANHVKDMRPNQSDAKLISSENNVRSKTRQLSALTSKTFSRNHIMKTLQSWRDNVLGRQSMEIERISSSSESKDNYMSDSDGYVRNGYIRHLVPQMYSTQQLLGPTESRPSVKRSSAIKRREPRRHTVGSNGIDFHTIKRIQQFEQERSLYFQGLEAIDRARDWYLRQIASIQDKIAFMAKMGSYAADYSLDANQERINFQSARILNVNQHLNALITERGFPVHMNLAIRPANSNDANKLVVNPNLVNKLREHNRLLTDEVSKKSERVTVLEREKAALIRELFQARQQSLSKLKTDINDDSTFM